MRRLVFLLLIVLAGFAALVWAGNLGLGPVLITREDEQKIVLLFGRPTLVTTEPGIRLRIPFVTDVVVLDKRALYLNAEPLPIQTRDEERLVVDNYVVWRIADPLEFYRSFPQGRTQAEAQIDRVVRSDIRNVIGQKTLSEVVTQSRVAIMQQITRLSSTQLAGFGIRLDDVRLNRTELPAGTEQNVYMRMRTERERLARKARAEGEEEGRRVRAEADREALVLVAEASRDAAKLRGEGDAEAARIFAEAFGADPGFYSFLRSLDAYRKAVGDGTTLVLPPSSEFFHVLGKGVEPR